jgi:hypothetical protein
MWTASEAEGPSTNTIITIVTDNGVPPLSATNSFTVVVTEVNGAPVLPIVSDLTTTNSSNLTVTNTALDLDLPANEMYYVLTVSPAGASIGTNGIIKWHPAANQAGTTNLFETVVTDSGIPPLSATNSFQVIVESTAPIDPPVIQDIRFLAGAVIITWKTVAGSNYRLQFQDNLGAPEWSDFSPDFVAEGTSVTATNIVGELDRRFYRVLKLP